MVCRPLATQFIPILRHPYALILALTVQTEVRIILRDSGRMLTRGFAGFSGLLRLWRVGGARAVMDAATR